MNEPKNSHQQNNNMTPKIESGIPIPPTFQFGKRAILRKMAAGDSIACPESEKAIWNTAANTILGSGNYTLRKQQDGTFRLWRTA